MSGAAPHSPHWGLVLYAALAGLAMVSVGCLRLRLSTVQTSAYSPRAIRATYGLMIALGLLLVVLAAWWRWTA